MAKNNSQNKESDKTYKLAIEAIVESAGLIKRTAEDNDMPKIAKLAKEIELRCK